MSRNCIRLKVSGVDSQPRFYSLFCELTPTTYFRVELHKKGIGNPMVGDSSSRHRSRRQYNYGIGLVLVQKAIAGLSGLTKIRVQKGRDDLGEVTLIRK